MHLQFAFPPLLNATRYVEYRIYNLFEPTRCEEAPLPASLAPKKENQREEGKCSETRNEKEETGKQERKKTEKEAKGREKGEFSPTRQKHPTAPPAS
jgi:hypothetical protein